MKFHHYIVALFGIKTAGMHEAQYPGLHLSRQARDDINAYLWINITSKIYALSSLSYGVHSVTVKHSWLGMIIGAFVALLFYGFRGAVPDSVNQDVIAHINKR